MPIPPKDKLFLFESHRKELKNLKNRLLTQERKIADLSDSKKDLARDRDFYSDKAKKLEEEYQERQVVVRDLMARYGLSQKQTEKAELEVLRLKQMIESISKSLEMALAEVVRTH